MLVKDKKEISWTALTIMLSEEFAERAKQYDSEGTFVYENYRLLKKNKFFSAMIPTELGGNGLSYSEMCECIRITSYNVCYTKLLRVPRLSSGE